MNTLWGRLCLIQLKNHEMEQLWSALTVSYHFPPQRMALASRGKHLVWGGACSSRLTCSGTHAGDSHSSQHTFLLQLPALPPPNGTQCFQRLWHPSAPCDAEHVGFHLNHLTDSLILERGYYCWRCEMPSEGQ